MGAPVQFWSRNEITLFFSDRPKAAELLDLPVLNALNKGLLKRTVGYFESIISSKIAKFASKYLNTDMIMKHLSTVGPQKIQP